MKFGQQLRTSLIKDYYYYYISYDELKTELKSRLYPPGSVFTPKNPRTWTEDDEKAFVQSLEAELDKVFTFQKVKAGEIIRRIKASEKQVEDIVRRKDEADRSSRRRRSTTGGTLDDGPSEDEFEILEEELSDIIADVHDLAKYTQLNYTGFQKIIKKHDKQTGWTLKPIFSARLNAKPFFRDNYDEFIVKLSKQYDLVRTRGQPVTGDSGSGGKQQNFVRQTTKYWVHPDNITELKLIILKHLPVLVFNASKEFEKQDSAITSIYYDNPERDAYPFPFPLYRGRLEKTEGAEAIRMRWYGGMDSSTIFVERKTHREDWTGEKSVKARFPIKEKQLNGYLKGEVTVDQVFEKMRKDGKKSLQEIENLEALAREIQYTVITSRLVPTARSFYNRTAFQLPEDARVRISLDTELTMVREDNMDGAKRAGDNWRRMDIGIDWPFLQLSDQDALRFPYAVLEVKLQTQFGQEPPEWVRDLVSSHLVEAVPKFSKFIHGCATLFPNRIDLWPYWMPQMDVDIRKPISHKFGIERPGQYSLSTSDDNLDSDDEDEDDVEDARRTLQRHRLHGDEATDVNIQRMIAARDALEQHAHERENGGTGNTMDAEERVGGTGEDEDSPLLEPDEYLYDSDVEEEMMHPRPKWSSWKGLKRNIRSISSTVVSNLHAMIPSRQSGLPSQSAMAPLKGNVYAKKFKAPPGKRIFVPVRVEPKVHFATERTFLAWLEFSVLLGAVSATLLNFGDSVAIYAAGGFTIVAIFSLIYSLSIYLWRVQNIRIRRAVRYHDKWGPTGLCVLLFVSVCINFFLRFD